MSFTQHLWIWLHVAFAVFALGPLTAAVMSTPRQIRAGRTTVVKHLRWATRVYTVLTLGVLVFGIAAAESLKDLGKAWVTASMTLFIVAIVCLLLIMRDQRRAIAALETADRDAALATVGATSAVPARARDETPPEEKVPGEDAAQGEDTSPPPARTAGPAEGAAAAHVANVERGRIASLGGLVALIWLVVLVLMVWRP